MNTQAHRVVVVTGAAGTLGAAIAEAFHAEGAAVVAADLKREDVEQVAARLDPTGERVLSVKADVTEPASVESLVDTAVDHFGQLDVMVNNAGIVSPAARLHDVDIDDFRRVLDVNVLGVFHGIRAALREFRPRGAGVILNTASISGHAGWPGTGPYCASKAAVVNLTRVAALEYGREGIRVNAVCPGAFDSAISADLSPRARQRLLDAQPSGRIGTPAEIASAFVYLASPGAGWVNGESLVVDGGFLAR